MNNAEWMIARWNVNTMVSTCQPWGSWHRTPYHRRPLRWVACLPVHSRFLVYLLPVNELFSLPITLQGIQYGTCCQKVRLNIFSLSLACSEPKLTRLCHLSRTAAHLSCKLICSCDIRLHGSSSSSGDISAAFLFDVPSSRCLFCPLLRMDIKLFRWWRVTDCTS